MNMTFKCCLLLAVGNVVRCGACQYRGATARGLCRPLTIAEVILRSSGGKQSELPAVLWGILVVGVVSCFVCGVFVLVCVGIFQVRLY